MSRRFHGAIGANALCKSLCNAALDAMNGANCDPGEVQNEKIFPHSRVTVDKTHETLNTRPSGRL